MENLDIIYVLLALTAHLFFEMDAFQIFAVAGFVGALAKLYLLVAKTYQNSFKLKHKKSPSDFAEHDGSDSHLSL